VARIEGTGIKTPSKKSIRLAGNLGPSTPVRIDTGVDINTGKPYKRVFQDFGAGRVGEIRLKKAEAPTETFERRDFFSMTKDPRNDVQVASTDLSGINVGDSFTKRAESNLADNKLASAGIDSSSTFNESDFANYMKGLGIKRPKALPPTMQRMLRENYRDDMRDGFYKDGQFINKAPVEKKPTIGERVASFTGGVFNALTGTQSAVAQTKETGEGLLRKNVPSDAYSTSIKPQYQINREQNRPLTSSNLDAAKAVQRTVDTGDTSFSSYRMGGGENQQEGSGIVTPFSQTSMGKGESRKVTPFSETSMGQLGGIPKTSITTPKTVTVDGQTVAARQTVASLPSNYKATEAEAFRKAEAFQEAKKIAQRNPNVSVGVDSKGQPVARAVQKTRDEAGPSARTAAGNQARVKQNAQARAQAAAVNRKLSGTKPQTAKQRAQDAAKARKAAGPNRKMSAGQQTRSQAGASARTAQGNRARVKSNARKRAQAAAKKRRAKKKKKCDIFLKYNISPLTNMNLIRDDLAEVAYFVKEIQK